MWEAHHRGRSLVLVTHLERAELFVEQFADRGLPASIEPA
jgi:ATP-dependent Clp protease adapter protein ClpS